jgi:hypothetical protein
MKPFDTFLGLRTIHTTIRYPRDFHGGNFRGFTARQMADNDSCLFNQGVPAGQQWRVSAISFVPEKPKFFDAYRTICTEFPTAMLSLKVANLEALAKIPLSNFWTDGEYVIHPAQKLPTPGPVLNEMVNFAVDLELPTHSVSYSHPAEVILSHEMKNTNAGFRIGLTLEVFANF